MKPFFIAEIGVNFYDTAKVLNITPLDAAKLYIDKAAEAGIQCAKFQSYKANTIVSRNSPAYWDTSKENTKTQYELFKKFDHFNREEYAELSNYAHSKGMKFTSTPFDYESADYLEDLVDFYKISSSDFSNLPFIRYIARKRKPIYISCGASYLSEVEEVIRLLKEEGCTDIVLLHCVLSYPTDPSNANLNNIKTLKTIFPDIKIGYSDHVPPDVSMVTITTAYLMGAEVIEKHFTLDKKLSGNDHYHAGDPNDFKLAINNCAYIDKIRGSYIKTVLDCETKSREQARRSLVLIRDMKKNEILKDSDLIAKRPGTGISPRYQDIVIGRKLNRDLKEDTILTWEMI